MESQGGSRRGSTATAAIFLAAIFSSAALTFVLQPLFARMVTPLLGGSPAVWNTSMVFFQAALLVGYVYAHALQRIRSLKRQVAVHAVLLLLASAVLPVWPSVRLGAPDINSPTTWLLAVLALSIGAPFMVASATAPLLQAWYARSGRHDAHDPYFLYAASNVGSLLGLLSYPVLVEPLLGLRAQGLGWSWGYAVVAILVVGSGAAVSVLQRGANAVADPDLRAERVVNAARSPARERLYWLVASAVPSSLLIGTTQHIVTDLASAPFLWIPPLVLYLLTFVVAFRKGAEGPGAHLLSLHAGIVALVVVMPKSPSIMLDVALRLMALFSAALVCHAVLATARPSAARLTEYFIFVSLGGVLGGGLTVLAAPLVFDGILEFPLALAATLLLRPSHAVKWRPLATGFFGVALLALLGVVAGLLSLSTSLLRLFGGAFYLNRGRPRLVALFVLAVMAIVGNGNVPDGRTIFKTRTFFGAYRIVAIDQPNDTLHLLMHGSTLHGVQRRARERATTPLSYYAEGGALHEAVRAALPANRAAQAAFVGLGSGAMACALREGDHATFIEIDPEVVALASNPRFFTYLRDCPRQTRIILGDGRLEMANLPLSSLDVVLIDAFSSDAIPTHLLTREAVRAYMGTLRAGGVLVLHVSNRHLAIANEAVRVAAAEALSTRLWSSPPRPSTAGSSYDALSASAVLITRDAAAMDALGLGAHWRSPPALTGRPWSDDFVNLLRTMSETGIDSMPTRAIP